MFAIVIPADPGAEKLRKAVALRRNIRTARWRRFTLARGPQRSKTRELVVRAQEGNPGMPQRHRGTERGTTDEHG